MKVTALFFFAGFVAASAQSLDKPKVDQPIVCIKKDERLDLTIVKGKDGDKGLTGVKGRSGERGPRGLDGRIKGVKGTKGAPGAKGMKGLMGDPGEDGYKGVKGERGFIGKKGAKGEYGEPGQVGLQGEQGCVGETGTPGEPGDSGPDGRPFFEEIKDLLIHSLNDYQVAESGYHNKFYHVTARDLTDGRTDTGGWGSETAKAGNYIQATFLRPVYVTLLTVAGGYIPSWNRNLSKTNGKLSLEYSTDGKIWKTSTTISIPGTEITITVKIHPVTAQYWRLRSTEDKWVGTTEFALKPLVKA